MLDTDQKSSSQAARRWSQAVLLTAALALATLHGVAIWHGMGGRDQVTSDWPIATHDHPLHFHYSVIGPKFMRESWTTAGYDPSFMAGYAKSILFPASSTLNEVVAFLAGSTRNALVYKLTVLGCLVLLPWLLIAAGLLSRAPATALCAAVALFLIYFWTDFPVNYAEWGMQAYLVAVPLGLVVTVILGWFLSRGGIAAWLAGSLGSALVVMVHPTSAMLVAPAAAVAYVAAVLIRHRGDQPFPITRHVGVWLVPVVVLAANAFWWWPGLLLADQKGDSSFAFSHPEGAGVRLAQIVGMAAPVQPEIQVVLWALGLAGLVLAIRREPVVGTALAAFAASGFFWGYLSGESRALDFLQPGRQTYGLYTALSLAGGMAVAEGLARLRKGQGRLDLLAVIGLALIVTRLLVPALIVSIESRLAVGEFSRGRRPFLASAPPPRLRWVLDQVTRVMKPGERLLYEESGFDLPGIPDPFAGGRYSGLLPTLAGVEVLGGPYLHVALRTNFTQFGEGKLFGLDNWTGEDFQRYGRLYGPSAILCWSPRARAFCQENPEIVEILGDDGVLIFGRLRGFDGPTIEGRADVVARPGRLEVRSDAGELDGLVVLRYHYIPYLRADPPARLEPVPLEGDPVPFIGVRLQSEATSLRLDLSPG